MSSSQDTWIFKILALNYLSFLTYQSRAFTTLDALDRSWSMAIWPDRGMGIPLGSVVRQNDLDPQTEPLLLT